MRREKELSITGTADQSTLLSRGMSESPVFVVAVLLAGIFIAEGAIMYLLHRLPHLSPRAEGILDAALLTVTLFPLLYVLVFRPLAHRLEFTRTMEKELEAKTESILASMTDALIVISPDGSIQRVNPAGCRLTGYSEEELTGMPIGKVIEELPVDESAEGKEDVFGKDVLSMTGRKLQAVYDGDPEDFWSLLKTGPLGVVVVDPDGKIVMVNEEVESVFGYDRDELPGNMIHVLLPPDLREVHEKERSEFMANPTSRAMGADRILKARRKDGTVFEAEVGLMPLRIDGNVHIVSVIGDPATKEKWEFIRLTRFGRLFSEEEFFWSVERNLVAKDGRRIPGLLSGSVVYDDARKILGAVLVIRDVTDRKRREEELKASEERYRKVVELSPDIIAIHQNGKIVFSNPAALKFVGAEEPEQLIGKPVLDFVHPDYRETVAERIGRVLAEGERAPPFEEKFIRLDGTEAYVEVEAVPFDYRGKPAVQVIAREITERKEAEEKERAHRERIRALREASQALVTSLDFREVTDTCATIARELIDADGAVVFLLNTDGTGLEPVVAKGLYKEEVMATLLDIGEGITGSVFSSGRTEIVNRVDLTGRGRQIPGTPVEPESLLSAPLKVKEKIIGVMTLRRSGEREFVDEDRELIENLANISALAIENARLFSETEAARQEVERLADFPKENPFPVVELDIRLTLRYINPAGEELLKRLKLKKDEVRMILPSGCDRLVRNSLRTGTDVPATEVELDGSILLWTGHPLKELGLVHFYATDITDRKEAEEAARMRTEQILHHQKVLLELAKMDSSDLDSAQKRITEVDSKTLGVERVSVWCFNDDRSEIICDDLYRRTEDLHEKGLRLRAKEYPRYFRALEKRRLIVANDATTDPLTSEFTESYLKAFGITSVMDIPVRLHGEVVGIVCHEHTGPKRQWTQEEQDFAASIGDMVSLALEGSERRRAEGGLRTSKEYTENLIRSSLDMIIAVDNRRRITEFNKAAEETFGYSRGEVLGKNVNILYADEKQGLSVHKTTVRKGRHVQEILNRRKNGEDFSFLRVVFRLTGFTGKENRDHGGLAGHHGEKEGRGGDPETQRRAGAACPAEHCRARSRQ
ncbi:MAG: PAS domain S-box protein [Fidelibacterota bacterium]